MKLTGTQKFLIFFLLVVLFIIGGRLLNFNPEQSRQFLATHSPLLSSAIFIFLYVVGTFFIWVGPKDILRVASVFVFGLWWSTVLVYIGEMLNMVTMFWFSRMLGRPFVEERVRGKMKDLDEVVSNTSAPTIFFMKFYPIISFRFLDLGYGLTKISFLKYSLVTLIAAPVRLFVVQYFIIIMFKFGFQAVTDFGKAVELMYAMAGYFLERKFIFVLLETYVFSGIIFFIVLFIRHKLKKRRALAA